MYKILTFNSISPAGLSRLPSERYEIGSRIHAPDAILLRSYDLHGVPIPETVKAVGRAGAGVNNIPVEQYSRRGIPVFNAPGANANAVAELAIAGMLLAARNLPAAWDFARSLDGDDEAIEARVEQGKKDFAGFELAGKTLGVVGLGAIGVKVANAGAAAGLRVIGFDPAMTVESAWRLSSSVCPAASLDELLTGADLVSLHVPLNENTRHIIDRFHIEHMKRKATLLNFSRGEVVDPLAVRAALDAGTLHAYVCDFPSRAMIGHPRAIVLPHLGASTAEAEDNCAGMVAEEVRDFLENGNIRHAVNFPDAVMARNGGVRLCVANENVPNMVAQISTALGDADLNIADLLNKSRGAYAYTLIDLNGDVPPDTLARIRAIDGVLSARLVCPRPVGRTPEGNQSKRAFPSGSMLGSRPISRKP